MESITICLVTAPLATEFVDLEEINTGIVRRITSEPQLGVLSLAAVLERLGDLPKIIDLNRAYFAYAGSDDFCSRDFVESASELVSETNADVFGFSTICNSYPMTIRIAEAVKKRRPEKTVLLGGPQASVVDRETLQAFPFIDLILRGEAELTLPLLLNELANAKRLDRVPGLTYRVGSSVQHNPAAPVVQNLDELPRPAYHLTEELRGAEVAALEVGRGCPFSCTFCSTNEFFRRKFRLRSPERVLQDMRAIAEAYSIRRFSLAHDMLTVDRRRVLAFCDTMISSGDGFRWSCSARTDCVDEELLDRMAEAGCWSIFFGVESGSPQIQKIINKNLNVERVHQIIDAVEQRGMKSTVSLIAGFPEENWDDVRGSLRVFMHSLRCANSSPQLNLLAPLAQTRVYLQYRDRLSLEDLCSTISHQGQSQREADIALVRGHPEIFPNFYLLPTPHMDRACLLELREFLLLADGPLRWMFTALDQAGDGILDVFIEWRAFRLQSQPGLTGPGLRQYYRTPACRRAFVEFVATRPIGQNPAVQAFVNCERILNGRSATGRQLSPAGTLLPKQTKLRSHDLLLAAVHARVVELSCDIQKVVDGLKHRGQPEWESGPHFYITEPTENDLRRLVRISPWLASVLRACDGRHNLSQVVRLVSKDLGDVAPRFRNYVVLKLIEGARRAGHIEAHRRNPTAVMRPARALNSIGKF